MRPQLREKEVHFMPLKWISPSETANTSRMGKYEERREKKKSNCSYIDHELTIFRRKSERQSINQDQELNPSVKSR